MVARVLACLLFGSIVGAAQAAELPCDVLAADTYPAPNEPAIVTVWATPPVLERVTAESSCGVPLENTKLVVALRGSFRFDGSLDDLLARIGAISTLEHLRYWSTTEQKWLPFIKVARALSAPDSAAVREDFSAAELRRAGDHAYLEQDNRSSRPVVYTMRVTVTGRDSVVVDSENVSPVKWLLVTLFEPRAMHSHVRLRRVSPGVWGMVQLDWVGAGANLLALGHEASYVNRTAALFRHIAGIPSDQEPPAAR
jgi:hypothetical protein